MPVVKILRSVTSGHIPPSLQSGQIAINEADGILFWNNNGTVESYSFVAPTAPTQSPGDNSNKVATTAFVEAALTVLQSALESYDTTAIAAALSAAIVRYDVAQTLTASQQSQARANIGSLVHVSGYAALAALNPANDPIAYVHGITRPDLFVWNGGTAVNAQVTADATYKGWYVPPATDTTGASGAWVRCAVPYAEGFYPLTAWGITVNNSGFDNIPRVNAALKAIKAFGGGNAVAPIGTIWLGVANSGTVPGGVSALILQATVNILGAGKGSTIFKLNNGIQKEVANFTGSITGNQLTVSNCVGTIRTYTSGGYTDQIVGVGLIPGCYIVSQLGGTGGGNGVYQLNMSFASPISAEIMCSVAQMFGCMNDDTVSTYDNLRLADFDIDMNAGGNTAGNGCGIWSYVFALWVQRGDGICVERCRGLNHGGSNTFGFGMNVSLASFTEPTLNTRTTTNLSVKDCSFISNGSYINASCLDHSTFWTTSYKASLERCSFVQAYTAGATRGSTAVEIHGYDVVADDCYVYGYGVGFNVPNEVNGNLTSTGLGVINCKLDLVQLGIVVWNVGTGDTIDTNIHDNRIQLDPVNPVVGIDAWAEISGGGGSGNVRFLSIKRNTIKCAYGGSTAYYFYGIRLGRLASVDASFNEIDGICGPAFWSDGSAPTTALWRINNNTITNCGFTTSTDNSSQMQSCMFFEAGNIMALFDCVDNDMQGSCTYGITGGVTAADGLMANTFSGIGTKYNTNVGVPIALDAWAGLNTLTSFSGKRGRVTHT